MKFTLSEINNNPQETNKEGKEARIQINHLIKCFPDNIKLKEFIITKPLLQEMLKGLI